MNRLTRWLSIVVLLLAPAAWCGAETVKSLPAPTGYINDFAGVLSGTTKDNLESLCTQVDRQAHAQIAVVTINTLDDGQSIEEFATELEDKWGVGNKDDRGVLMVFVMKPRKGRIEVGYGLEGILNDAKVGDIGRSMVPAANQGDYNAAIPTGVRQIATVIADDAGVAIGMNGGHVYRRQRVAEQQPVQLSLTQVLIGGGVILLLLVFLARTGNLGILFFLLGNLMGGGGGRGGYYGGSGRGGGDDGGFGGFGGGRSGGGGADF
ncbi:MAG: TPM domain-containing protein [Edaphobacter sp.]|uniref:TPM domain-containing protein n=1 Tax=Edaphobacter sp. TaxID=1934404 RepID=UPI002387D3C3|nr:TPM domain-containing protein [Edaphobacter sp.]MDE1178413.1 TPM domain-containing protein [Edaphobacter sp.]